MDDKKPASFKSTLVNQDICSLHLPITLRISISYKHISDSPILINNKPIPKIDHYSCLGENMDERMSWEKHVECICSKVSAGIGAMRRLKPFVPLSTLKMLYNAIIQPYFDYCSPLWDNCGIGLN